MSVTAAYVMHGLVSSSPSFFLSQITGARATPGVNAIKGIPSGLPGARFIYNINQTPEFSVDVPQIKTVLDNCGTGILDLGSGNTDYFLKHTVNRASRVADATNTHIRLRANKAVMIPQQLSASDGQPASMSVRLVNMFDGSTAPIVASASTLSGTPSHAENFTLGPVALNSTALNGVQSVSVDFGISTVERRGDGELYLSHLFERETLPVIRIQTLSAPWATYGINGTALTGLSLWLRKCAETSRVADGTEEHILLSGTAGFFHVEETSGAGNEPVVTTITVHLAMPDATTRAMVVDTTAAIS